MGGERGHLRHFCPAQKLGRRVSGGGGCCDPCSLAASYRCVGYQPFLSEKWAARSFRCNTIGLLSQPWHQQSTWLHTGWFSGSKKWQDLCLLDWELTLSELQITTRIKCVHGLNFLCSVRKLFEYGACVLRRDATRVTGEQVRTKEGRCPLNVSLISMHEGKITRSWILAWRPSSIEQQQGLAGRWAKQTAYYKFTISTGPRLKINESKWPPSVFGVRDFIIF